MSLFLNLLIFGFPLSFSNITDSTFFHLCSDVDRVIDAFIKVVIIFQMVSLVVMVWSFLFVPSAASKDLLCPRCLLYGEVPVISLDFLYPFLMSSILIVSGAPVGRILFSHCRF